MAILSKLKAEIVWSEKHEKCLVGSAANLGKHNIHNKFFLSRLLIALLYIFNLINYLMELIKCWPTLTQLIAVSAEFFNRVDFLLDIYSANPSSVIASAGLP